MPYAKFFSPDYFIARERFRSAAAKRGMALSKFPVAAAGCDGDGPLTIDVAIREASGDERAIVISSGLHGVEGFFGSAVQLALLESEVFDELAAKSCRLVLLHGLNPFGFAQRRRFNEDNVDLNRNFLLPDEPYSGSPKLYPHVDRWLNPSAPPRRWWPVPLAGSMDLVRYGMMKLFAAIPAGQYDYPQGLFYGGSQPAESTRIVEQQTPAWLGGARRVVHLDFHTGLGEHGSHRLLLDTSADDPCATWFARHFGQERVSALPAQESRTFTPLLGKEGRGEVSSGNVDATVRPAQSQSYNSRGSFGHWCRGRFADREYRFATAEFGTYGPARVLLALRAENRAHHWGQDAERYEWTKRQLVEAFAPTSQTWRERVVRDGLSLIRTAADLRTTSEPVRPRPPA